MLRISTIVYNNITMVNMATMLKALATKLKQARQAQRLSLEAIAKPARISAAYLHKLEQGGVGSPSPRVLRRLAGVLALPYLELMEACGYLDEAEVGEVAGRKPRPHPLVEQELSAEEWRAVKAFIATLKANRTQEPEPR